MPSKKQIVNRMREKEVQKQVMAACAVFGVHMRRQNTGGANYGGQYVAFGEAGDPDLSGMLPDGRRIEIEVKRPGARPRANQIARIQEINRLNGVAFWTDDAQRCVEILSAIIHGKRPHVDDDGNITLA